MRLFLKHYGEKRTGTNYLRALLVANFPDVVPLTHVLGDKHSAPVPLQKYWDETSALRDRAWQFVTRATFAVPAETTKADDPDQLEYLRSLCEELADSFAAGRFGFVISVKNPYAWAASYARYCGWMTNTENGLQMATKYAAGLQWACQESNRRHRAWLDHCRKFPAHSIVVRYEDLLAEPAQTLVLVASKFGLDQPTEVAVPKRMIGPPVWDNDPPLVYQQQFDSSFYEQKRFMNQLNRELWDIVDCTIDWKLMGAFAYQRAS